MEYENISGVFRIELDGQERKLKACFGAIEMLESTNGLGLRKTIIETLQDAINRKASFNDIVATIYAGLASANDTRLTRREVGEAIFSMGMVTIMPVYIDYLTHLLTGGKVSKQQDSASGE